MPRRWQWAQRLQCALSLQCISIVDIHANQKEADTARLHITIAMSGWSAGRTRRRNASACSFRIYIPAYMCLTPGLLLLPLECARRNTMKDHAPAAGRLVCSQVGGNQLMPAQATCDATSTTGKYFSSSNDCQCTTASTSSAVQTNSCIQTIEQRSLLAKSHLPKISRQSRSN